MRAASRLRMLTASGAPAPTPFPPLPHRPGPRARSDGPVAPARSDTSVTPGAPNSPVHSAASADLDSQARSDGAAGLARRAWVSGVAGPERRARAGGSTSANGVAPAGGPAHFDGPAARMRSGPIPPSFEALRTAVATQGPMLAPGRPGLRLLLLIALVAAVAGGVHLWRSQPEPEPLAPPSPVSGPPLPTPASTLFASPQSGSSRPGSPQSGAPLSGSAIEVTVHVTGKVRRAGVITLPAGSRVTDAVQAAGGVRRGAAAGPLNLARKLVDGEQIVVGASGPAVAAPALADPAAAVLDLNAATQQQLEQLPGVGEVLARRIAEYRDSHGGFRTVEQLRDVSGIGDRKYAELKDKVHV